MSGFKLLFSPMLYLEEMVSNSATFQSITGSASAAAAKSRIRLMSFVEDENREEDLVAAEKVLMPRISLFPLGFSSQKSAMSNYSGSPRILFEFEYDIPDNIKRTHDAEARHVGPIMEAVIDEITTQGGQQGCLDISAIEVVQPPVPLDPVKTDGNRIWICDVILTCRA